MLYLDKAVVLSGIAMWVAVELRRDYWTAQLVQLEATPAPIVMMLGSPAIQVRYTYLLMSPKRIKPQKHSLSERHLVYYVGG